MNDSFTSVASALPQNPAPHGSVAPEQQTAAALLKAAEKLFSEKGYEAVSTREIATAAGANLAAIRYHFGSKELLFNAVVKKLMSRSLLLSEMLSARDMSAEDFTLDEASKLLHEFVKHFLLRILDDEEPQGCRLMLRESASISQERKELVDRLVHETSEEFIKPLMTQLVRLISVLADRARESTQQQSTNSPAPQLSPELCARSIIGQCFFYQSHRLFIEHLEGCCVVSEIEKIAAHITNFSLRALGVQYADR
jgi:AcrR family transcriptional regulator